MLRDGLRNAVRVADRLFHKADELDALEMMADVSRALATVSAGGEVLDDAEGMRRLTYVADEVISQDNAAKAGDGRPVPVKQTRVLVFGGSDGVSDLRSAEAARDAQAAEWQSVSAMMHKRRSAGCAAIAGKRALGCGPRAVTCVECVSRVKVYVCMHA